MTSTKSIRLAWREYSAPGTTTRDDGAYIDTDYTKTTYTMEVHFEVLEDDDWTPPADGHPLARLQDGLRDGDDWQDSTPYTAAEDRLLTRADLTRDDLAETDYPW